jgi:hypothetical protein
VSGSATAWWPAAPGCARSVALAQPRGVEVETADGVLDYPRATRDDVPGIVAGLVADGHEIFGVRVRSSTLEDAYLEAVGPR